jgi:hypothetical protein
MGLAFLKIFLKAKILFICHLTGRQKFSTHPPCSPDVRLDGAIVEDDEPILSIVLAVRALSGMLVLAINGPHVLALIVDTMIKFKKLVVLIGF